MNSTPKSHVKRKRGIALSANGLRRLNQAIHAAEAGENHGKRFTVEELSHRTSISTSTLSRLWTAKSGVDRRTLHLLFNAFKLDLLDSDLQPCLDDVPPPSPQPSPTPDPTIGQIPYPSGPVAVDSPRYIGRSEADDRASQEILQPGCVIRIKAPSGFGKTSLLLRLLQHCQQLGYATVAIDLQQADRDTLADSHAFLRWFCAVLSLKLELDSHLDHYWDDLLGSKLSTTLYLRESILPQVRRPLVLVITEVERVFAWPNTAQALLPLLRSWHEEAQHDDIWKQLRLVVTYSTDAYLPLDINQSPFNVGLPLILPEFSREQVQTLATLYPVHWPEGDGDRLLALIGGNPALVGLALYHLHQGMPLDDLLHSACTLEGIYRNHLQRLLAQLNANPQWIDRLAPLIWAEGADWQQHHCPSREHRINQIGLDPSLAYKLEGIGLIKPTSNGWQLSCELYRVALQTYLFNADHPSSNHHAS